MTELMAHLFPLRVTRYAPPVTQALALLLNLVWAVAWVGIFTYVIHWAWLM